jgi:lipooligosaccharide transport system permease protein
VTTTVNPPLLRVTPPLWRSVRRPQRMIERSVMVYRRTWIILVSGFFEPLFYLLSIRVGFGSLVGDVTYAGRTIGYAEFVAPALMASSAMNGAVYDSTMNVYFKLKHSRLYEAVLATPMGSADVAVGEIGWAVIRGAIYSAAFLVCIVALGMAESAWVVMALPACILIGIAFASVGMAATTYMRTWADFDLVPTLTMPMFLFSATFYPLSAYGDWAWLVQLSPLYHGVALVRGFSLGDLSWAMVAHASVLVAIAAVGLQVASRRVDKLLLT